MNQLDFIANLQRNWIAIITKTLVLFEKNPEILTQQTSRFSGNSKKLGFYMVYNKKTKKFYLGSSIDFGLRVSYYNRDFKNYFSNSRSSLYSSFIEDIKTNDCSYSDFFFIPLISFEVNSIKFEEMESLKNSVSTSSNSNTRFLETIP